MRRRRVTGSAGDRRPPLVPIGEHRPSGHARSEPASGVLGAEHGSPPRVRVVQCHPHAGIITAGTDTPAGTRGSRLPAGVVESAAVSAVPQRRVTHPGQRRVLIRNVRPRNFTAFPNARTTSYKIRPRTDGRTVSANRRASRTSRLRSAAVDAAWTRVRPTMSSDTNTPAAGGFLMPGGRIERGRGVGEIPNRIGQRPVRLLIDGKPELLPGSLPPLHGVRHRQDLIGQHPAVVETVMAIGSLAHEPVPSHPADGDTRIRLTSTRLGPTEASVTHQSGGGNTGKTECRTRYRPRVADRVSPGTADGPASSVSRCPTPPRCRSRPARTAVFPADDRRMLAVGHIPTVRYSLPEDDGEARACLATGS